jgi:hypothetical protein
LVQFFLVRKQKGFLNQSNKMADSGSGGGRQSRHRQHQQQPTSQQQQQQQHHQQQQHQHQQQYYEEVSQLSRVPSGKSANQSHYDGGGTGRGSDKKQQRHHGGDNRLEIFCQILVHLSSLEEKPTHTSVFLPLAKC